MPPRTLFSDGWQEHTKHVKIIAPSVLVGGIGSPAHCFATASHSVRREPQSETATELRFFVGLECLGICFAFKLAKQLSFDYQRRNNSPTATPDQERIGCTNQPTSFHVCLYLHCLPSRLGCFVSTGYSSCNSMAKFRENTAIVEIPSRKGLIEQ
jgi:hypothetical protein